MVGGSRIIAFGSGSEEPQADQQQSQLVEGEQAAEWPADEPWEEESPQAPRGHMILAVLALVAIAGWTVFFAWANWSALPGIAPQQAIALVSAWAPPVLVVCILWLIALRTSTREAARFNDAARQLRHESGQLELRLSTVNRELSLAREFIASQSRDLDSLGRIAVERISQHADRLDGLIKSNGAQIEAIATVSETALDNMERLRGSLPVIVSSAKDVTNNIGNAGRSAQGQLQELINGFNKLNEFGQASERQVESLRNRIDEAIALFSQQTQTIEETVTARFAALEQQNGDFRAKLDSQEVETLAAIRTRATALAGEMEATRRELDEHESESLTSLRARLSALREETAAIGRALRDGEGAALTNWQDAIARLETDMQTVAARLEEADRRAIETAQSRLAQLGEEAARFDQAVAVRSERFDEEIARRESRAEEANLRALAAIRTQLASFDEEIARRHAAHEEHSLRLVEHGEQVAGQLGEFAERMRQVTLHGENAESALAAALQTLATHLAEGRSALSGTEAVVATLTDSSVRLLELIQASATHASVDLPAAIAAGEERLEAAEARAFLLRDLTNEAAAKGDALSSHVLRTHDTLTRTTQVLETLHGGIEEKSEAHSTRLGQLQQTLHDLQSQSTALAEQAEGALSQAIAQLAAAARDAVADIEQGSAGAIAAVAQRLGEESAVALDKVMRIRAAEAAGQLEQAAAHAAGVSREAAIQLRDQLAKVNELAGNLERRVAHARERAEEQVDNDFARRSALITEALNSHAIDIAKALDSDVSDTAWAAYLKGDRGIFTRRAVRLLDTGEARSVLQIYDADRDFRDHVSHYIHDFEAILRQMLSTRDGHALGVTLLSSDMGKLYVALAQSIERLRD